MTTLGLLLVLSGCLLVWRNCRQHLFDLPALSSYCTGLMLVLLGAVMVVVGAAAKLAQ